MKKQIPVIKTKITDKDIWDFTVIRKKYNKILQLIKKHDTDIIIKSPHRPEMYITHNPIEGRMYTMAVCYDDNTYYVYNRSLVE